MSSGNVDLTCREGEEEMDITSFNAIFQNRDRTYVYLWTYSQFQVVVMQKKENECGKLSVLLGGIVYVFAFLWLCYLMLYRHSRAYRNDSNSTGVVNSSVCSEG